MAAGPIKVRCTQCKQLLGVARSKAGGVVACPKCAAEIVVPWDDEPSPAAVSESTGGEEAGARLAEVDRENQPTGRTAASVESLDTGVSLDFLQIRPEDIRVEPGVRDLHPSPPPPPPPPPAAPPPRSHVETEVEVEAPVSRPEVRPPVFDVVAEPPPAPGPPVATLRPTTPPAVENRDEPIIPAIRLDDPVKSSRPARAVVLKPRDLVIPRSVVASWSMLVLFAVAFAFLAGLMIGHFVWRLH